MSIFAKCMENDADHNVGRMKLDHGPTQVAPPWFLVTRAAVLRHGAICDCLVTFHASILNIISRRAQGQNLVGDGQSTCSWDGEGAARTRAARCLTSLSLSTSL